MELLESSRVRPRQARYQAALHPDISTDSWALSRNYPVALRRSVLDQEHDSETSLKLFGIIPQKEITLIPRRAARAVKGARRAFILTLDSPSRPIESQRERSETKFSEASFPC
jgi:hypothetical protein